MFLRISKIKTDYNNGFYLRQPKVLRSAPINKGNGSLNLCKRRCVGFCTLKAYKVKFKSEKHEVLCKLVPSIGNNVGNNEEQLFTLQVSSLHCLFGSRNSQVTHTKSVNMDLDPRKHVSKKPTVSYKYVAMETTKLHLTAIMCDLKKPQT